MTFRRGTKSTKSPPIFSHEFVIQNHADIVSCVAMVFVVGLVLQATNPLASLFVALQHNVTTNDTADGKEMTLYTCGFKDICTSFFYLLLCIVLHAVIQEYILDKVNRRMHLSKVKHSKFNESGQLLFFYLAATAWGIDVIIRENYLPSLSSLWDTYPQAKLPFFVKLYFIIQIAYWVHSFPELYFQKVKRDEMPSRIQYAVLYLGMILAAYLLNFSRVAMVMLILDYSAQFVFHATRLLHFAEKAEIASTGFLIWDALFVLVRMTTITLAFLTFWYGLKPSQVDTVNFAEGNFNTQIVRLNCLVAVCLLQAWLMWNFIVFHLRRRRDVTVPAIVPKKLSQKKKDKKPTKKAAKKEEEASDTGDSPAENGNVRQRTPKAAKRQ